MIGIFIDRLRHGRTVEIHGDGEQTRDFVFVSDVADAVARAVAYPETATLNVGSGRGTTVREILDILVRVSGVAPSVRTLEERPHDIRHSRLDPAQAFAKLGWQATIDIETGVTRTWLASG